jgi:hypothetical protein
MSGDAIALLLSSHAAAPAEAPYSATIELSEHQARVVNIGKPSGSTLAELTELLGHPATRALVSSQIVLTEDGDFQLNLSTDSTVGFAAVGQPRSRIFVRVRPKVPTQRLLELAQIAGRLPPWKNAVDIGEDDVSVLLLWTLSAFADSLNNVLAMGGVRSTHERRVAELRGKVRGKLLIPAFAANLSRGRPDRLPCRFASLDADNEPNRLLRWAIHVAQKLCGELPGASALGHTFRQHEARFSAVSLVRPSTSAIQNGMSLPPNLRHYQPCIAVARMLLKGAYLDAKAGSAAATCVALDMNELYEAAFSVLIKECAPSVVAKPKWSLDLRTSGDGVLVKQLGLRPDIFVPGEIGKSAVLIDTKWKHALAKYPSDVLELDGSEKLLVRPKTSDVYQATTYAIDLLRRGSTDTNCVTALVYPALGEAPDLSHEILLGSHSIMVRFLGWDVTRPPRESIADVWARLDAARFISAEA